jgi:hypothetical protein
VKMKKSSVSLKPGDRSADGQRRWGHREDGKAGEELDSKRAQVEQLLTGTIQEDIPAGDVSGRRGIRS